MTDDLAGRLLVTLDLDGVGDKAAFMERVVRALDLPYWFGRNWDALADSLTDDTVWPAEAVERGLLLVVRGWQEYAQARPEEWETAREVFAEAADQMPGLSVALTLG
jgi:RNAse (barnase) inhibitor barstar